MERRFIEGQTVDLSIPNGEGASAHTTSVLNVSGEEIVLRRPPTLNGGDQGGVVVEFRPEGDQEPPERGEIEFDSNPRILKLRRLEQSEDGVQRREMLRKADEFPIRFRFISFSEHSSRKIHLELTAGGSSASRAGQSTRSAEEMSESESLMLGCLQEMNHKFDRLVELMTRRVEDETLMGAGVICDISGSGLRFRTDRPPGKDSYVEIQFDFPGQRQGPVAALGEIMRAQKDAGPDGTPCWILAVHFTAVTESDRDRIVAHVLIRQRAEIKNP
ncbi:MAG: PilZ domain-containing protein [Nitrospinota bacterium]|jgi:hypothetical protein|nr:PilZ domain-containing protein [Nitrospinota bacterium]HJM43144.1 PilZ domain-containing protein [Nitrospinota bacterium]